VEKFFEPEPNWRPPLQIKLPAIGATWHVVAKETNVPWVAVRELDAQRLLVFGNVRDERACRAALTRWLMRQTQAHLIPPLAVSCSPESVALPTRLHQAAENALGKLLEAQDDFVERQAAILAAGNRRLCDGSRAMSCLGDESLKTVLQAQYDRAKRTRLCRIRRPA
jgi:hypothetical protein